MVNSPMRDRMVRSALLNLPRRVTRPFIVCATTWAIWTAPEASPKADTGSMALSARIDRIDSSI